LALTGQVAELAGTWYPLAFLIAGIVAAFSSYSYIKVSQKYPSSGGVAMILKKAYGPTAITGSSALLMYFSMVINESLVARTFAEYVMQAFNLKMTTSISIPVLGVGLLIFAFAVNLLENKRIEKLSYVMAFVKLGGLLVLVLGGLWGSGGDFKGLSILPRQTTAVDFIGAVALGLLAFKGFTTITNSGGAILKPKKNIGRAIQVSLGVCLVFYLLICFAVAGSLNIEDIVVAKDYVLAEAARPVFGKTGVWITVIFAITATVSGAIFSIFAVSRMLSMLTKMEVVPHSHLGMPGDIQKHTLVYTTVLAMVSTVFLDMSKIAALGAIFYVVMDLIVHWGVIKYLRKDVGANLIILITTIALDFVVLGALIWIKIRTDTVILLVSFVGFVLIYLGEKLFIRYKKEEANV
jgi:amino acid transporter